MQNNTVYRTQRIAKTQRSVSKLQSNQLVRTPKRKYSIAKISNKVKIPTLWLSSNPIYTLPLARNACDFITGNL